MIAIPCTSGIGIIAIFVIYITSINIGSWSVILSTTLIISRMITNFIDFIFLETT